MVGTLSPVRKESQARAAAERPSSFVGREIGAGGPRREGQEEAMKTFTALVLVAFAIALPVAFVLQIV